MADKATNAKEFGGMLALAWESSPSFICSNDDYIYCLFPADDTKTKWVEASLTFPDGSLDKKEIDSTKAIATTKGQLDEVAGRLGTLT
jgi:hypothetical protein